MLWSLSWPADRQLLVVELDPAGNDLAARLGLNADPGLVSLAAQGRRQVVADDLWAHSQPLPGSESGRMVLGPSSAEQTVASLAALRGRLAPVLAEIPNLDVLVDCGRLEPGSPCLDVVAAAILWVALDSIGKSPAGLYDGSWTDWGSRSDTPAATGSE